MRNAQAAFECVDSLPFQKVGKADGAKQRRAWWFTGHSCTCDYYYGGDVSKANEKARTAHAPMMNTMLQTVIPFLRQTKHLIRVRTSSCYSKTKKKMTIEKVTIRMILIQVEQNMH